MSEKIEWSPWQTLLGFADIGADTLAELLDGGQAFRWNRVAPDLWQGVWESNVAQLGRHPKGHLHWRAPIETAEATGSALLHYLAADSRFEQHVSSLPWRSDTHLARCMEAFPGLRILRQPFGETLLCFLCSATKQIVQIKQMVELLAQRHGKRLAPGIFALPEWRALAGAGEAALRACLLGFRARYISETAKFLATHDNWLSETETLPYQQAKDRLCTLPGVGEKVADCVLLFGAGKMEAFPVDVWIIKTMERRYGLEGWKPAQIAHFGRVHFGPAAGIAQQFLFAYERQAARAAKLKP